MAFYRKKYFDIVSVCIKSERHWNSCFSEDFTELFCISSADFSSIMKNFPKMMSKLVQDAKGIAKKFGFKEKEKLMTMIGKRSSRMNLKVLKKTKKIEISR